MNFLLRIFLGHVHHVTDNGSVIYEPRLSNINPNATIGSGCRIHTHVWIGGDVKIGDRCKIQAFAFIPDGVTIGNGCFIAPRVTFTNDRNPPSGKDNWMKTVVKDSAVIGAGAVILPGVTIGERAMVGAGAVVTKDVPDGVTVVGNPARPFDRR